MIIFSFTEVVIRVIMDIKIIYVYISEMGLGFLIYRWGIKL